MYKVVIINIKSRKRLLILVGGLMNLVREVLKK